MSPTIIILALLATATFGAGIPNVLQARGNGNGSTPLTTTPLTNSQAVAAFSDPKLHPDLISTQQIGPPHNGTPMAVKPVPFASQVAQNDTGFSAKIPISIDISPLPGNQQPWPTNSTTIEPTRRSLSARGSSCEPGYYCSPDNRYIFEDDRYPWSAIGRIQTPISTCTGALVGPHHVLTAAHCIDWKRDANGNLGWVAFEPEYWPGHDPFTYYAKSVHYWDWTTQGDPQSQEGIASDYVVVILDVPGGDTGLGYFGAKTYSTSWNNLPDFELVGYPDLLDPKVQTPYSEPPFPILNAFSPENFCFHQHGLALQLKACISKGNSGGPVFAWWNSGNCVGPCIVGVVQGCDSFGFTCEDWTSKDGNYAAGGSEMVQLIISARTL